MHRPLLGCATLLALAACAPGPAADAPPNDAARAPVTPHPGGGWYEIARTPGIVAYMDTARFERVAGQGGRVWYRFEYPTPLRLPSDSTTAYRAGEMRLDVNCREELVRGLEMRMETTEGVWAAAPTPEQKWQPLDEHPFGSGVFFPACRALGMPLTPRGR